MNKIRSEELVEAVGYYRTSSAANVGDDKDSYRRQREAVHGCARRDRYRLMAEYYDAAVSGTDPIDIRPGFSALLDRIEGNGVRVVLVEDASRLARSVLVQELAILALRERGVRVIASNGDDLTETDDEMKVAMRQIGSAFAQLERTRLVKKLKAARERKRATGVKVEGRKSHAEVRPEVVALAKKLRRRSPKTGNRRSLRDIAQELARQGYTSTSGRPFSSSVINAMIKP